MGIKYSAERIRSVREGMEAARSGGMPVGRLPKGYRLNWNPERGKFVEVDPFYGPMVKEAFKLMASGRYTLGQAADELRLLGWTMSDGRPLAPVSLHGILHNRTYMSGFEGAPPLVNAEEFFSAQGALRARAR
jgi:hypothetical protein